MAVPNTTPPTLTEKDVERFWANVDRTNLTGCWPWIACCFPSGYGKWAITIDRNGRQRTLRAHRVAFFLGTGEWPPMLMHSCDRRPCCNFAHLNEGTALANVRDAMRKGRMWWAAGETHKSARLRAADVRAIRRGLAAGEFQRVIGERYGVTQGTIGFIARGLTWKSVK